MSKGKKYSHLYPDLTTWPIHKLYSDRSGFVNELRSHARKVLLKKFDGDLQSLLERTVYFERKRIRTNPWKVDPQSDSVFWKKTEKEILKLSNQDKDAQDYGYIQILDQIIHRYSEEIVGNFKISAFKFARKFLKVFFTFIYTSIFDRRFIFFGSKKTKIESFLKVSGEVELLRSIFKKGNIVLLPTHSSNLDSILLGYILDQIVGIPSVIYGAGLNLFDAEIVAYFMNRLGPYRIDRRKMNAVYLETLKSNSNLITQKGVNALFFPGGTRSRSGVIEDKLKYGLLGSLIESQREIFEKGNTDKIIVIPVIINNNFVLEAPSLIQQELRKKGKGRGSTPQKSFKLISNKFCFFKRLISGSTDVSLSFGTPLDVLGNRINEHLESIDTRGNVVSLMEYYLTNGELTWDEQREKIYTKQLANRVLDEYHSKTEILCSNLIAFVAFTMIKHNNPDLDIFDLVKLDEKEIVFDRSMLLDIINQLKTRLNEMLNRNEILLSNNMKDTAENVLQRGLDNLGIFHVNKPLLTNKNDMIVSKDLRVLYFYYNRLSSYKLEDNINWTTIAQN